MKALTIWQPWATLIAHGHKPYEFRGWKAPAWLVGQRIAVHAGKRKPPMREIDQLITIMRSKRAWSTCLKPAALDDLEWFRGNIGDMVLGAVVATAVVGEPIIGTRIAEEFGGPVNDSDRDAHANWGWPMLNVEPVLPPVPVNGRQGIWDFRESLA